MKLLYFVIILKTVVRRCPLNGYTIKVLFFKVDRDYLLMDNTALSMKSEFDGLIGV
ncbi:hypothetical protein HMPREF1062_00894 [Bacteroides cellulosilyticus CL02T12C19]|jgi:hypothetical protein|uniref:Uncharacterized protein n=1 Tax=Bacteroides cellulosilyticus CL02T12C19 TaxID=997874 RepID=I8WDE7_9BACE|nr:hypothetical protein HMPREF1062_00894 [Bacteroides cellulosilyticus CL02T12C19]